MKKNVLLLSALLIVAGFLGFAQAWDFEFAWDFSPSCGAEPYTCSVGYATNFYSAPVGITGSQMTYYSWDCNGFVTPVSVSCNVIR